MDGFQHFSAFVFDGWQAEWRSFRIARAIYPALWEIVRRKIPGTNETEFAQYSKAGAAQLAQEQVVAIMQENSALSGVCATRLLLRSTERAVKVVLAAVANARRSAA
jgi:hypothetical protein